jgi:hypothetical protein
MVIILYIFRSGSKYWYRYNIDTIINHRITGPAVERYNGSDKSWYYKGKYIHCNCQKDFIKILKLKALW